ncbi:hypothetical protein ACQ4WX_37300 [Streptomyces lasalocidi]
MDWQHLILSSALTTPPEPSAPGPPPGAGRAPEGGPGDLAECPECKWLGPADSAYCGGDCGRPLRGSPA